MGVRYIWDPGQQCARMDGSQLRDGVEGAAIVICNDYEFELIRQKTGMSEADVLGVAGALIVTRGEHGSDVITGDGTVRRRRRCRRIGSSIRPGSATPSAAA